MSKQTAVDLFHDRVNELIAGAKSINSNSVAKIWLECKAMEREQRFKDFQGGFQAATDAIIGANKSVQSKTYGKEASHES